MGSELKQYVKNSLMDAYDKLLNEETTEDNKKLLNAKVEVLKDVDKICKNRGRY